MFPTKHTIARLASTGAVAAALVALAAPNALARVTDPPLQSQRSAPLITDTLAPGGSMSLYHRWFLIEHARPVVQPQGYRFITDTLAPGGGTSEAPAPAANGFDWADAGIGAAAMTGILTLLGSLRAAASRRRVVAA